MKAKQHNLLKTAHAVATVWKTFATAAPIPAIRAAGAALHALLDEINTHTARQAEPLTGKTRDRNQVFAIAGQTTYPIARLLLGHALAHGLEDLAARVDFPESALRRGSMLSRLELMRRVHAAARERAELLAAFGITPEILKDFAAKIAAAEAVLTAPRTHIAHRVVATQHLGRCFRELDRLLKYTLDPLMELQRATDPDAYVRYQTARLVIETRPSIDAEVSPAPAATPAAESFAAVGGTLCPDGRGMKPLPQLSEPSQPDSCSWGSILFRRSRRSRLTRAVQRSLPTHVGS
jgi:hypothetical protein